MTSQKEKFSQIMKIFNGEVLKIWDSYELKLEEERIRKRNVQVIIDWLTEKKIVVDEKRIAAKVFKSLFKSYNN